MTLDALTFSIQNREGDVIALAVVCPTVCRLLGGIHSELYWLGESGDEITKRYAPTADQRNSFEKIRGAR